MSERQFDLFWENQAGTKVQEFSLVGKTRAMERAETLTTRDEVRRVFITDGHNRIVFDWTAPPRPAPPRPSPRKLAMSDDPYDYVSPGLRKGVQMKCANCAAKDARIAELEDKYQHASQLNKDWEESATAARLENLSDALSTARAEIDAQHARIAELEEQNKRDRTMSDTVKLDIPTDAAERIRMQDTSRSRIVQVLAKYNVRLDVTPLDALAMAVDRLVETKDARIAELEDRIARFGYPETARIELSTARARIAELEARCKTLEQECDAWEQEEADYEETLSTARAEIEALRKRVGELEEVAALRQRMWERANARAEQAEKRVGELEAETHFLTTERGVQQTRANAYKAHAEQAEAQLAAYKVEYPYNEVDLDQAVELEQTLRRNAEAELAALKKETDRG
jgi:chromosome segregation ATPase